MATVVHEGIYYSVHFDSPYSLKDAAKEAVGLKALLGDEFEEVISREKSDDRVKITLKDKKNDLSVMLTEETLATGVGFDVESVDNYARSDLALKTLIKVLEAKMLPLEYDHAFIGTSAVVLPRSSFSDKGRNGVFRLIKKFLNFDYGQLEDFSLELTVKKDFGRCSIQYEIVQNPTTQTYGLGVDLTTFIRPPGEGVLAFTNLQEHFKRIDMISEVQSECEKIIQL